MALVELKDVHKDYALGKTTIHALRGVDLSIEPGEFATIAGPSGCGKTTLLNLVGCIDKPTAGDVRFAGTDVTTLSDKQEAHLRLSRIGFIFQSFNLIPVLTVYENVEFPTVLAGKNRNHRRDYIRHLLDAVGLDQYAHHKPDELSGGQRQRVAIARALVNQPELVIADEPTANLDSETGEAVLQVMKRLNEEDKVTFLFSTHDPEVMKHADRVIRLRDGLVEAA